MADWTAWIGLPHEFGANPADGKAADCVVMVWAVLRDSGVPHPAFEPRWLELASSGQWDSLRSLWDALTEPLSKPEEHAVCLFENGSLGLGVGIVVNNGVLIVHHRRGVCWVPFRTMRNIQYCRFK